MEKVFNMVVDEFGIGVITFDVTGDTMNTWTEAAFTGFDRVMRELEIAKGIRGDDLHMGHVHLDATVQKLGQRGGGVPRAHIPHLTKGVKMEGL